MSVDRVSVLATVGSPTSTHTPSGARWTPQHWPRSAGRSGTRCGSGAAPPSSRCTRWPRATSWSRPARCAWARPAWRGSVRATSSRPPSTRRARTPPGQTPQPRPPGNWSSGWPTTAGGSIAIAPHGGDIEPRTDDQAEQVRVLLTAKGRELLAVPGLATRWRRRRPLAHHLRRSRTRLLPAAAHRHRARLHPRGGVPRVRRLPGAGRRRRGVVGPAAGDRGGHPARDRPRSPRRHTGRPAGWQRPAQRRQPAHGGRG